MIEHHERQDQIWQFFRALNEGRVQIRQTHRGDYLVTVTPPYEDETVVQTDIPTV